MEKSLPCNDENTPKKTEKTSPFDQKYVDQDYNKFLKALAEDHERCHRCKRLKPLGSYICPYCR